VQVTLSSSAEALIAMIEAINPQVKALKHIESSL